MGKYSYINDTGAFCLENPDMYSYLYFPLANEGGIMSSITPDLGGDSKLNQNSFLLSPVSSENLHNDKSSRNIWCRINGKNLWSVTGKSSWQQSEKFTEEKEKTYLKAEFMCHEIQRVNEALGVQGIITSFVPFDGEPVEVMKVSIKNLSKEEMELDVVAAIPVYGRSADNIRDHRHVTSLLHRIKTHEYGVTVKPAMSFDERGHKENQVVYGVFGGFNEESPLGFFPITEEFLGEGGSFENPRTLYQEDYHGIGSGEALEGYEAMGAMSFKRKTLKPKERAEYIFVLGYGEDSEKLQEAAKRFIKEEFFNKSLEATKKYWQERVNVKYHTGNEDFDLWMRWVSFQPMLRRIYGCSFLPHHDYGKGGRGWRDLWQDCLALLIMNPEGVKEMLLDNFQGVRIDGTNATIIGKGQGEFIADRNNITRVWMDHGVWPFLTTKLYIDFTGDLNILLNKKNYFKDIQTCRGEGKDLKWQEAAGCLLRDAGGNPYEGTILEHLLVQHLTAFYDVGAHNHIRLRGADWNDALDMAEEKGESAAFTAIYGSNLEGIGQLLRNLHDRGIEMVHLEEELALLLQEDSKVYDDPKEKVKLLKEYCEEVNHGVSGKTIEVNTLNLAENLISKGAWIKNHIRDTEWLQEEKGIGWFNGYYDNKGQRVEGAHPYGSRIMLTSQVFTIMSGTAHEEQIYDIVKAADKYLYDDKVGGYKLNSNFHEVKMDLGRMFGFGYGHKENGAVFSHMAVMFSNALYGRKAVHEGYKVIKTLFKHCGDFEKSKIYPGIPEYIDGKGRGMYHYLTGAASWLLLTVITESFGVKGHLGDLVLEPKLLKEQFDEKGEAALELNFAQRNLRITMENKDFKDYGKYEIAEVQLNGECLINRDILLNGQDKGLASGSLFKIPRKSLEGLKENQLHEIKVILKGGI